jgi:lambda repressor-like predicted transcriptional regulator
MKSTQIRTGMKPAEIKAELTRRDLQLTDIAAAAGVLLPEVSYCIGGSRIYPEIRKVIAAKLGLPLHKVFGKYHPQPKGQAA